MTPYRQWTNGDVELLNQYFVNRLRSLVNDRGADWTDCPAYVPAIQETMNKLLFIRDRGDKTTLELIMEEGPHEALSYVVWLGVSADVQAAVDPQQVQQVMERIHHQLPLLWVEAVQTQTKRRAARRM